jgi:hypothetical protein
MIPQTISDILSALTVLGIIALLTFVRQIVGLPKEMLIVKAALFRLLRSNKKQGLALAKIAECQKKGTANGDTDIAVAAVTEDQDQIDKFLVRAAFANSKNLEDLMKEDE